MSSSENTPANILKGEACETDEEDKGTDEADVEEVSSGHFRSGLLVEGEASESDSDENEMDERKELKSEEQKSEDDTQTNNVSKEEKMMEHTNVHSVASLLQSKLREKNVHLLKQIKNFTKNIFSATEKEFQVLVASMLKSKSTLQNQATPSTDQGTKHPPNMSTSSEQKQLYIDWLIGEELYRLKKNFESEVKNIRAPKRRDNIPYVFNKLTPYSDMQTVEFLVNRPELLRFGYTMRPTASGLCDPWVDLEMDKKILPKIEDKPLVASSFESPRPKPKKTPRTSKKGSTMCPQFPVVTMPVREWETKALNYMDVPDMRHQLDKRFMKINNKDKTNVEYVRTKEDFYRMELNKLNEVHPSNRSRIKRTYEAYLRNTPGSRQAIQECLKNTKVPSKHAQAH